MGDEETRRLLNELDEAIRRSQEDGRIDDDERAELLSLVERAGAALAEPEGEHGGVIDNLESAAVRFEGDHPKLATLLRSAVNTISGYGI